MALLQIGRFGADFDAEVASWGDQGNSVQVSGDFYAATVAEAKAARRQLVGYVDNPDVDVVPVVWSEDDTVDGFYRVLQGAVSTVPTSLTSGFFEWSATLQRVPGFRAPQLESGLIGEVRDNAHSITDCRKWFGLPPDFTSLSKLDGVISHTSEDGEVYVNEDDGVTAAFDETYLWSVPPSGFYDGSARIEHDIDGAGTWRDVTGRQVPDLGRNWRLNNGLVRVTPKATGGQRLEVSWYDGAAWSSVKTFEWQFNLAVSTFLELTVLRNTPEKVVIRGACGLGGFRGATATIDIALRRGTRTVEVVCYYSGGFTSTLGVQRETAEASTAITAGVRATADDADGNRFMLLCPSAITTDTTQGGIETSSSVSRATFAISTILGGAVPDANSQEDDVRDRWMAAMDENVRVVTR